MSPAIFAAVGSDARPFNRFVRWIDCWLEANADSGVEAYMQTGTSSPPRWPVWSRYVDHDELDLLVWAATVVVCDGAPASITRCTSIGKTPIVIPRSGRLGEAVDEHQLGYCRRLAARGAIWVAEREDGLGRLLTLALRCTGPGSDRNRP